MQRKKKFTKRWSRQDFHIPGSPLGVKIPDRSMGALEKGLKYLKRQMKDGDIIGKYKSKKEYVKPSAKKRMKLDSAIRNQQHQNMLDSKKGKNYVWTAVINGEAK